MNDGGKQDMSAEALEIINLRRQIEIQNEILQKIFEELKLRNEKLDKIVELDKDRNFDLKEIARQYY